MATPYQSQWTGPEIDDGIGKGRNLGGVITATSAGLEFSAPLLTWPHLAEAWSAEPSQVGTATVSNEAGAVWEYTLDGVTRYRFVPDVYNPTLDAFYSEFTGGALSGLIVARG